MFHFFKRFFVPKKNKDLKDALENNPLLVDVRSPAEYGRGSINGAQNIPLNNLEKNISLFKKAGKPIIVFCFSGTRSQQAKNILESHGIKNVINGKSVYHLKKVLNEKNEQRF